MQTIKKLILIGFFALLFAIANYLFNPHRPNLSLNADEITLNDISKINKNLLIVDARSRTDFQEDHIENAINLSEEFFDEQIGLFLDVWTPESNVLVYCGGSQCNSSRAVANRLKNECELKNVFVLKDDWRKWNN